MRPPSKHTTGNAAPTASEIYENSIFKQGKSALASAPKRLSERSSRIK
jgi:hypothetical protein